MEGPNKKSKMASPSPSLSSSSSSSSSAAPSFDISSVDIGVLSQMVAQRYNPG